MRRKLVVGNWKMHGSREGVGKLINALKSAAPESGSAVEIAVCPTYLHIGMTAELLQGSSIALGAQDANPEEQGAFTGEVAAAMLADFGVRYVIVGHSERRSLYGESDQLVAEKFVAVQKQGLIPILCVGESLQQRENGQTESVVLKQLSAVVDLAGIGAMAKAVVAYEPVWAIGTGKTATPDQAQNVHALLRAEIASGDKAIGDGIQIIYGGSVKAANAAELFAQADIDGALVGGASLKAEEFISIFKSAVS